MNATRENASGNGKAKRRKKAAPDVVTTTAAVPASKVVDEIRSKVDQLAMEAMLGQSPQESTPAMLSLLSEIMKQAAACGLPPVTSMAGEMHQALSAHTIRSEELLQSITNLQRELDSPQFVQPAGDSAAAPAAAAPPPAPPLSLGADPELLGDFIVESRDHLANIEKQVLILEQDPANRDAIHSIFRGFHTIKGLAGFLELPAIREVAHEVETLLDKARNGQLEITSAVVDVVLESADYIRTETNRIELTLAGSEAPPSPDYSQLLLRIQEKMNAPAGAATAGTDTVAEPAPAVAAPAEPERPDAVSHGVDIPIPEREVVEEVKGPEVEARNASTKKAVSESRVVKVDTNKLDYLVDMVGELVIAQSMVRHDGHLNTVSNPKLQRNLSQLARITAEVQKTAMAMRMVPVGQLFQRSARLVRDLTRKSNKKAELELAGEDTELDRTIVEELADPLLHMVRNSADHGIESVEERIAAGKNPVGKIALKAYHQAGHIVIEVSDDGKGLNRQKILAKACERGLVPEGTSLADKEILNLIFEPGFSTAEQITDVSGRGVGMDVVRKHIQKMRGRIDIESCEGKGTTFYLKLPLTLAIIDGLVLAIGNERYILPIYVVKEMFRPNAGAVFTVEGRHEMILVRGTLLPVIRLYERFGVQPRTTSLVDGVVVVAESGTKRFCLMVDSLIGKQEVVIKSLGETFKQVTGVAGGAILGDGRVGLILDVDGLWGGGRV